MQRYSDSVILAGKGSLQAMAGARVYVYHAGTSTLATIYSDNGSTEQANPLTAGSDGEYSFFAADGLYDIQAIVGALSDVKRGVQLWGAGVSGAVGDGVTDDTAGVAAAVLAAYSGGYALYWPAGTYLTTASIPYLHQVRHYGPGVIKRGSDLFTVEPHEGDANTLYVSPTGTVGADGLSASQQMASFQEAFTVLKNYGPMLDGTWTVQSAAGTYTGPAAINQTHTVPSRNRVYIQGPTVASPGVPTCIIDGSGGVAYDHGIRVSGVGVRAYVRYIKGIDYTTSNSRIAFVGENECDFATDNLHADNCDWHGVYVFNSRGRISGGILENCRLPFGANASEVTLGYSTGPVLIRDATTAGVYWSRGSQGHIDYCDIEDCPVGVDVDTNSRAHLVSNDFKRNSIAVRASNGGAFLDDGNVFNRGTADANTINIQRNSYTQEADEARLQFSEALVATERSLVTHTGATGDTEVLTLDPIPAYRLENQSSRVRIEIEGRFVAATAGTTVTVKWNGNGTALTITGAPLSNAAFSLKCAVREAPGGTFRQYAELLISNELPRLSNASLTFDPSTDITPSVYVNLANAADEVYIDRCELFILG